MKTIHPKTGNTLIMIEESPFIADIEKETDVESRDDFPMWPGDLWDCRFCGEWMVKLLTAKHELRILDETGCLDADLS